MLELKSKELITFFELLKAGLWNDVDANLDIDVEWGEVQRLAEEQSVVGGVVAGIEVVQSTWLKMHGAPLVPKPIRLQFIGQTMMIEQRNKEMNEFLANLCKRLHEEGIEFVVVKGQGVAQCYERPLWRSSGDVDLLLDARNYEAAKSFLLPQAQEVYEEEKKSKHQGMMLDGFEVELHGRMPFGLSNKAERVVDDVVSQTQQERISLEWDESVVVPRSDEHVFLVFTHFLHHFFIEGVGLRQICDWCRLLWTFRDELNLESLESRLWESGLMTEWKAFASLAIDFLGMPEEAMPFYDARFRHKGERILKRVIKSGNFGHNNDLSYRSKYSGVVYKLVATWRRFGDFASLVPVFPVDAPKFFVGYLAGKTKREALMTN